MTHTYLQCVSVSPTRTRRSLGLEVLGVVKLLNVPLKQAIKNETFSPNNASNMVVERAGALEQHGHFLCHARRRKIHKVLHERKAQQVHVMVAEGVNVAQASEREQVGEEAKKLFSNVHRRSCVMLRVQTQARERH